MPRVESEKKRWILRVDWGTIREGKTSLARKRIDMGVLIPARTLTFNLHLAMLTASYPSAAFAAKINNNHAHIIITVTALEVSTPFSTANLNFNGDGVTHR
jgi:hypothetical protein